MLKLSWTRAAAWRIQRHHLHRRAPVGKMLDVARRLCGLHAQVMSSAELTLWARVEDLKRGTVQRAIWDDRLLVKTWAMRGTLHLLPADELSIWHAALSTSRRYLRASAWEKYFGISLEDLDRLTKAVRVALDGRVMTREELAKEVGRITKSAEFGAKLAEGSWGTILKPAAFAGYLCFGPSEGQRVRFTRPDTWLGAAQPSVEAKTATATITRRFLTAYGPATYHDLARWWGCGSVATARQWINSLGDEVSPVDLEGVQAWMLTRDLRQAKEVEPDHSV